MTTVIFLRKGATKAYQQHMLTIPKKCNLHTSTFPPIMLDSVFLRLVIQLWISFISSPLPLLYGYLTNHLLNTVFPWLLYCIKCDYLFPAQIRKINFPHSKLFITMWLCEHHHVNIRINTEPEEALIFAQNTTELLPQVFNNKWHYT